MFTTKLCFIDKLSKSMISFFCSKNLGYMLKGCLSMIYAQQINSKESFLILLCIFMTSILYTIDHVYSKMYCIESFLTCTSQTDFIDFASQLFALQTWRYKDNKCDVIIQQTTSRGNFSYARTWIMNMTSSEQVSTRTPIKCIYVY